jgi:hypothetical protein
VLTCAETRKAIGRDVEDAVNICAAGETVLLLVVKTRLGGVITSAGLSVIV